MNDELKKMVKEEMAIELEEFFNSAKVRASIVNGILDCFGESHGDVDEITEAVIELVNSHSAVIS